MSSTANSTLSADVKRCPTRETDRPLDWCQIKVSGSQGLVNGTAIGCKQCREKRAAYMRRYRKKKATTKSSEPRSVSEHQLATNKPTPNLLDQSNTGTNTGTSTSAASAQEVDEKTQKASAATRLLDQDEIDAAADRLLDLVRDLQDDGDGEDEEEH